jgi:GNAT superfamily N-acetyltransferase
MVEIILRNGAENDIDGVFTLVQEFAPAYKPDKGIFVNSLNNILKDESAFLCVAEHMTEVIGYCLGFDFYAFYSNGRVSWLEEIMVGSNFQSMGVGQRLMDEFESWCISRKSSFINTATHSASKFYESRDYNSHATYFRKTL